MINWSAKACLSRTWGNLRRHGLQCPPMWDGFTCWGPTEPDTVAFASCPHFRGSDISKFATRLCSHSGEWLSKNGSISAIGWTNYTSCLTPEIREIITKLGSNDDAQGEQLAGQIFKMLKTVCTYFKSKLKIADNTRILELVGLSFSLVALILSLVIFYYFRVLRNSRTRLHRHLFMAMVIQVGIRLIVYTDQAITRSVDVASRNINSQDLRNANTSEKPIYPTGRGIENTPFLCEASYICLEYARTAMFMWMFSEGLFLHNKISVTVFQEKLHPSWYSFIGWLVPIPLTVTWALVTHLHYGTTTCWWGYNFTSYFWILEGPRLGVLLVNFSFLINILRVLVLKLRQSESTELQQAMKAVKGALVLLPLLGLTNLLNMIDWLEKSPLAFGFWSYTTHFLTSTQGLALAILYCFKNGEVQLAIRNFIRIRVLNNTKQLILYQTAIPLPALEHSCFNKNYPSQSHNDNQSFILTPSISNASMFSMELSSQRAIKRSFECLEKPGGCIPYNATSQVSPCLSCSSSNSTILYQAIVNEKSCSVQYVAIDISQICNDGIKSHRSVVSLN